MGQKTKSKSVRAIKHGPVIEKPRNKRKTTVSLDPDLWDDLDRLAKMDKRSLSNYMETELSKIRDAARAAGLLL